MSNLAVIQARMSSSRLPGKVVEPVGGMPGIVFMVQRLKRSKMIDRLVVATSDDPSDDGLATLLAANGIDHYRGALNDVLRRFVGAAAQFDPTAIVRLTGDCPLIDADIVDAVLMRLHDAKCDYVSNVDPPTYPDGLDVEAFTAGALRRADVEARLPSEREHVTPYLRRADIGFRADVVRSVIDLSELRWTVDYQEDLEFIRELVDAAGARAVEADRFDFMRIIEREHISRRSGPRERNEGLAMSLAAETGPTYETHNESGK